MTIWQSEFYGRWILSPLLYVAGLVPVLAVGVLVASVVEKALGGPPAYDIDVFVVLLVVGAVVFASMSFALVRLEHLRAPTPLDHLRHCVALYAGSALMAYGLLSSFDKYGWGLQWGLGAALLLVAVYAILLDALTLYAVRRRSVARMPRQ